MPRRRILVWGIFGLGDNGSGRFFSEEFQLGEFWLGDVICPRTMSMQTTVVVAVYGYFHFNLAKTVSFV